jgi:glycosyltransferase involved in cell wall biosynthesis
VKVSVITPSYNQGTFIERTLASVAAQSGCVIEHVVFDAGSTDGTVAILEGFRPPVRWVSRKDKGQADAVNQGIRASNGDVIGWLNSDDVYYPGAIARVAAFLEKNPDVDVVYGMADHIDRDDRVLNAYRTQPWNYERLKKECFICQPAAFIRRRAIEKYGLLDDSLRYCMDYEYWLRLGKSGARFAYLEEKLAGSRLHPETKTLGARVQVHEEINDMLKRTLGSVPTGWILNYAYALADARSGSGQTPLARRLKAFPAAVRALWRWNGPFAS